jgi:hypothetical protein
MARKTTEAITEADLEDLSHAAVDDEREGRMSIVRTRTSFVASRRGFVPTEGDAGDRLAKSPFGATASDEACEHPIGVLCRGAHGTSRLTLIEIRGRS